LDHVNERQPAAPKMNIMSPSPTHPILLTFAALHLPVLLRDEVRHNILIAGLTGSPDRPLPDMQTWTLGEPGQCAIRMPDRPILLGDLTRDQCHELAELTAHDDYSGVTGTDERPAWFVERAVQLGAVFGRCMAMQLLALTVPPQFSGVEGASRATTIEDAALLFDWMAQFIAEAVPHDPQITRERAEQAAASGRYLLWTIGDQPVAMASVVRKIGTTASIGGVYTPPALRGRGYGGAVTAAAAERSFAEGKRTVCLFVDRANPASNRCYARLGFQPYCDAAHYLRG
jgi:predicted GNAT family acetyltransferase